MNPEYPRTGADASPQPRVEQVYARGSGGAANLG